MLLAGLTAAVDSVMEEDAVDEVVGGFVSIEVVFLVVIIADVDELVNVAVDVASRD